VKLEPNSKEEVWAALVAPLDKSAISWRQDGKPSTRDGRYYARFVCYVEAGTVRERLDAVVPGEWDLTLEMLPQVRVVDGNGVESTDGDSAVAFKSRLQVLGVIREDVGTGKDYKSAATDAFKRAAVRFGIAHELYSMEQNWVEVEGDGKYAKPLEDPQAAYERRHGQGAPNVAQRNAAAAKPAAAPAKGRAANEARAKAAGLDDEDPNVTQEEAESVSCPKCGGRMWDNRLTKRNPKAPDWKCRDRSCDGVMWPPKTQGNAMDSEGYEPPTDGPFGEDSLPF
jgi:hypothetical protein